MNLITSFLNKNVRCSNIDQLKLQVHDSYKKDEKISTKLEPVDDYDVINESYLDKNLSKTGGHLSILEKDYNEYNYNSTNNL